jgi:predicted lipoprotein with Yx(FWY)xxD motif
MPPDFQVISTELEGPVFADARGRTLYKWPVAALRNGYVGDPNDKSTCEDKVQTKTSGFMSPYPAGLELPGLEHRRSCTDEWPPVLADADAKPLDRWTIITRSDKSRQWAYDHHPLYTSRLDLRPGDVFGGTATARLGGDSPPWRMPVGPPPELPPGFKIDTTIRGRMLVTEQQRAVYYSDQDGPDRSNCRDDCNRIWQPILAPEAAQPRGEWSIVRNVVGIRQWAFRKRPLYTYALDIVPASLDGGEVPGWHNAYTQQVPEAPASFAIGLTLNGEVLTDRKGMTVYYFSCVDDAVDQLSCDTLDSPQQYRLAICGGGDPVRCRSLWHYVTAPAEMESQSQLWSIVNVDTQTGLAVPAGQAGAVRVWAFRARPVYTYSGDKRPGDFEGNALGEWQGRRDGFRAFWLREEMFRRS